MSRTDSTQQSTVYTREHLEGVYGKASVYDTEALTTFFEVQSFMAPFVVVQRRSDGAVGTLSFQHRPRLYWDFQEDKS